MPYTYIGVNNGNGWKNLPSRETPRNAANFNVMENGIKGAYQGLNELDSKIDREVDAINQDISAINQDISAVNARVDTLESMTDLAIIDTQSGNGFVQTTIADEGTPVEIVIEGKTVVTPLDPTQDISPDNPATIVSVGDTEFDVVACGKNLFDKSDPTKGWYNSSGVLQPSTVWYMRELFAPKNTNITLSGLSNQGTGTVYICGKDNSGNIVPITAIGNKTINTGNYGSIIYSVHQDSLDTAQVEIGSSATPYEPYKGNKITISHPLRSIPNTDVKDTLEISSNGKGKYTQRIIRVTGQETFEFRNNGNGTDTVSFNIKNLGVKQGYNNVLCTHFKADNSSTNGVEGIAVGQSGELYIEILKSRLEGYSDSLTNAQRAALFKNWWTSNNVQAYAELTTPIVIEFDLTTLVSYKGITNILTTASIQPNITAKFYSRLGNFAEVIMARLDKITQALLALGGTV